MLTVNVGAVCRTSKVKLQTGCNWQGTVFFPPATLYCNSSDVTLRLLNWTRWQPTYMLSWIYTVIWNRKLVKFVVSSCAYATSTVRPCHFVIVYMYQHLFKKIVSSVFVIPPLFMSPTSLFWWHLHYFFRFSVIADSVTCIWTKTFTIQLVHFWIPFCCPLNYLPCPIHDACIDPYPGVRVDPISCNNDDNNPPRLFIWHVQFLPDLCFISLCWMH